ncbi:hypothetical protein IUM83_10125, partial [Phytophthora cinnamomi]
MKTVLLREIDVQVARVWIRTGHRP